MKHITTLIALALVLGSLAPLTAQNKMTAKEKRTQTRQERKIAQQKVKEELYQDAVRALENNTFVLEANRLIFKRGRSANVSSIKNFISMANKKATVQVSFDTPRPLQNGLGGFTVEGNVSDIRMKKEVSFIAFSSKESAFPHKSALLFTGVQIMYRQTSHLHSTPIHSP